MLYDVIRRLCDDRDMPIMALEQQAGLANGTVGRWRKEGSSPSLASISRVADVLHVSVDWIIKESEKIAQKELSE